MQSPVNSLAQGGRTEGVGNGKPPVPSCKKRNNFGQLTKRFLHTRTKKRKALNEININKNPAEKKTPLIAEKNISKRVRAIVNHLFCKYDNAIALLNDSLKH